MTQPTHRPMDELTNRLSNALFDNGCIQFGSFILKSGITSPIYLDLRLLVSHPPLMREVGHAMARVAYTLTFDRIAAIPYAGLPIGVALALEMNRPLIYARREAKTHGTRRAIEGVFESGETVLLVDDLITRGDSKLEAIAQLESVELKVQDVLVLIDREQGGTEDLIRNNQRLHAVLRLTETLDALQESARITPSQHAEILYYLKSTNPYP